MKPASASHEQFERLAMPLLDALFNFARWLTHDPTEAEDLVQETFAKALRGFESFAPGTDFRAWMFRILRNTFLTSRTGLQTKLTVPLDAEDDAPLAVTWETPETLALASSTRYRGVTWLVRAVAGVASTATAISGANRSLDLVNFFLQAANPLLRVI